MQSKQIRLTNLRQLIKREGAVSQLALKLQISPIYIYRVLDGKFNIGDSMARKIEDAYGYSLGWMDEPQEGAIEAEVPTLGVEQRISPNADEPSEWPAVTSTAPRAPTKTRPPAPNNAESPKLSAPAHAVAASDGVIPESLNERIVIGIINTLNRILAAHGLEVSEMEKAKLLMKVAEKILDQRKGSPGSDDHKPFLKIS